MDAPLVVVEGLHKRYRADGPEAVAGIDFEVARGEVFGLLGPNGAGKTTTSASSPRGCARPPARVHVAGIDVARDPVAVSGASRSCRSTPTSTAR